MVTENINEMQKKLIFLLIFTVLIAIFALQNSIEVELKLWFWSIRTSMVLILILTFAAGAIAGILFSIPGRSKGQKYTEVKSTEETAEQSRDREDDPGNMDEFEDVGNQ